MKNNKIIDYIILYNYIDILPNDIREYLKNGWRPWGAPFKKNDVGDTICQAMVKYETEE